MSLPLNGGKMTKGVPTRSNSHGQLVYVVKQRGLRAIFVCPSSYSMNAAYEEGTECYCCV